MTCSSSLAPSHASSNQSARLKSSKGRHLSPELVLGNSAATRGVKVENKSSGSFRSGRSSEFFALRFSLEALLQLDPLLPGEKPGIHGLKIMSIRSVPAQQHIFLSGSMDRSLSSLSPKVLARSILIWDARSGRAPIGWMGGIDISGDSLDISRDGYTLLVGSHRSVNPLQLFDLRMLKDETKGVSTQAFQSYQWPAPQGVTPRKPIEDVKEWEGVGGGQQS